MQPYRKSFQENLAILLEEIQLAGQWGRPSILLTVHRSKLGRDKARQALKKRLSTQHMNVLEIEVDREHPNAAQAILAHGKPESTVFFVSNLDWGGGEDGRDAFRALNIYRELFVENKIKVIFWLSMNEAGNLARHAPDFWAFRHRVIEFSSPRAAAAFHLPAGVLYWWQAWRVNSLESIEGMLTSRQKMLADLPSEPEALSSRLELLFEIGYLCWKLGHLEKAASWLGEGARQAVVPELSMWEDRLNNGLAILHYETGEISEALEIFRRLAERNPGDAAVWMNVAFTLCRSGKNSEAEICSRKALGLDRDNPDLWNGQGYQHLAIGKLDEAVASFKEACELSPQGFISQLALAVCYHLIGIPEDAIQKLNVARQLVAAEKTYYLEVCEQALLEDHAACKELLRRAIREQKTSGIEIGRDPILNILLEPSLIQEVKLENNGENVN